MQFRAVCADIRGVRSEFYGLSLDVGDTWGDITPEDDVDWPPTLARDGGVGALQFSIARNKSGEHPDVTPEKLARLLSERSDLPIGSITAFNAKRIFGVRTSGSLEGRTLVSWYVSDGANIAFVTYTGSERGSSEDEYELAEADVIVRSIVFLPAYEQPSTF